MKKQLFLFLLVSVVPSLILADITWKYKIFPNYPEILRKANWEEIKEDHSSVFEGLDSDLADKMGKMKIKYLLIDITKIAAKKHLGEAKFTPDGADDYKKDAESELKKISKVIKYAGSVKKLAEQLERSLKDNPKVTNKLEKHIENIIEETKAFKKALKKVPRKCRKQIAKNTIEVEDGAKTTFTGRNFIGKVTADKEFVDSLKKIDRYAINNEVILKVTSSFRENPNIHDKYVVPAKFSNHSAGHAIDADIQYDGKLYKKSDLSDFDSLPQNIQSFLQNIRDDPKLRWGGDFSSKDPVHFDDGLNLFNKNEWLERYRAMQYGD